MPDTAEGDTVQVEMKILSEPIIERDENGMIQRVRFKAAMQEPERKP